MRARTLHLVDIEHCGDLGLLMIAAIVGAAPARSAHEILLIGGSEHERRAHRCGLHTVDRLHPPGGRTDLGGAGLRRFLDYRRAPTALCAWGAGAAALASSASAIPMHVCSLGPLRANGRGLQAHGLRRALAHARSLIFFERHALLMSDPELLRLAPSARLAGFPSLDDAVTTRAAARQSLGALDDAIVLQLIGAPFQALDGYSFARVVASNAVLGHRAVGVIHPSARQLERGLRILEKQSWTASMVVTDDPAHETLAGADVAIWRSSPIVGAGRARFQSALPILQAQAMGIPVVATRCGEVEDVWSPGMGEIVDHHEPLRSVAAVQRVLDSASAESASTPSAQDGAADLMAMLSAELAH